MRASRTNMSTKLADWLELREDALDDEGALEALRARHDGAKHLGHAALADAVEKDVAPEGLRLDVLQSSTTGPDIGRIEGG